MHGQLPEMIAPDNSNIAPGFFLLLYQQAGCNSDSAQLNRFLLSI
jgi:hypothetical protein